MTQSSNIRSALSICLAALAFSACGGSSNTKTEPTFPDGYWHNSDGTETVFEIDGSEYTVYNYEVDSDVSAIQSRAMKDDGWTVTTGTVDTAGNVSGDMAETVANIVPMGDYTSGLEIQLQYNDGTQKTSRFDHIGDSRTDPGVALYRLPAEQTSVATTGFPTGYWLYSYSDIEDDYYDDGSWEEMIYIDNATGDVSGRTNYGVYDDSDNASCSEVWSTEGAYDPTDGRFDPDTTSPDYEEGQVGGYVYFIDSGPGGTNMTVRSVYDDGTEENLYYYYAGSKRTDPRVESFYTSGNSGYPCEDDDPAEPAIADYVGVFDMQYTGALASPPFNLLTINPSGTVQRIKWDYSNKCLTEVYYEGFMNSDTKVTALDPRLNQASFTINVNGRVTINQYALVRLNGYDKVTDLPFCPPQR